MVGHWSLEKCKERLNDPTITDRTITFVRHLRAILFDARVHDNWSYEQLSIVQRIMNTIEKTATGVTPAELILTSGFQHPW